MQADQVLEVLACLQARGLAAWLDGGWGVDALVGSLTRPHSDVDLVVDLAHVPGVLDALFELGLTLVEDLRPARLVLRAADGRQVDLHPVTFDDAGTGWQAAAAPDGSDAAYPEIDRTRGTILGVEVGCISAQLQVTHHSGYAPRPVDRHDMALLSAHFDVAVPDGY